MKTLILTTLAAALSANMAFASNTPALIPDVAMASIIKANSIIKNLHADANEACQRRQQLDQDRVVAQVDLFLAEMAIADSLITSAFYNARPDEQNIKTCSAYHQASVFVSVLKHGLPSIGVTKPLVQRWKRTYALNIPACWIKDLTKEEVKYSDFALKSATRYREGNQELLCYGDSKP